MKSFLAILLFITIEMVLLYFFPNPPDPVPVPCLEPRCVEVRVV